MARFSFVRLLACLIPKQRSSNGGCMVRQLCARHAACRAEERITEAALAFITIPRSSMFMTTPVLRCASRVNGSVHSATGDVRVRRLRACASRSTPFVQHSAPRL
jgi:hypothetical protein